MRELARLARLPIVARPVNGYLGACLSKALGEFHVLAGGQGAGRQPGTTGKNHPWPPRRDSHVMAAVSSISQHSSPPTMP